MAVSAHCFTHSPATGFYTFELHIGLVANWWDYFCAVVLECHTGAHWSMIFRPPVRLTANIVDAFVISQANGKPLGMLGWISTSCCTLIGSGYFCPKCISDWPKTCWKQLLCYVKSTNTWWKSLSSYTATYTINCVNIVRTKLSKIRQRQRCASVNLESRRFLTKTTSYSIFSIICSVQSNIVKYSKRLWRHMVPVSWIAITAVVCHGKSTRGLNVPYYHQDMSCYISFSETLRHMQVYLRYFIVHDPSYRKVLDSKLDIQHSSQVTNWWQFA